MAYPTGTFSQTNVAAFEPDIWGERLNDFMKKKLVMANFFTNRSAEVADGGRTLETPNLTEMSANAKSNATAVTLNSATETKITLTVDQWYEVSFAIEDAEAAQVKRSYVLQERYAKDAAYTIASKLDAAIAALFSGFSQVVGLSTQAVVDSDLRKAIGLMEAGNFDLDECAFFFDSKVFWNYVMGLTNFNTASANAYPANFSPLLKPVGSLYGIPVLRSNNIAFISGAAGRKNALAHPDAIHFATAPLGVMSEGGMVGSSGIRVQRNYIPDFLSTLVTADILYGVIENRDLAGIYIKTKV
jgi:hypothetical protein